MSVLQAEAPSMETQVELWRMLYRLETK